MLLPVGLADRRGSPLIESCSKARRIRRWDRECKLDFSIAILVERFQMPEEPYALPGSLSRTKGHTISTIAPWRACAK